MLVDPSKHFVDTPDLESPLVRVLDDVRRALGLLPGSGQDGVHSRPRLLVLQVSVSVTGRRGGRRPRGVGDGAD